MRQLPLPIGRPSPCGFENFIAAGNEGAVDHLRSMPFGGPPVYLWGPAGVGKSHLLSALAERLDPAAVLRLLPAGSSPDDATAPGEDEDASPPALVVIDDCHRLDARLQRQAFNAFVEAAASGTQIAAAGDLPPVDLPVREDLRTRLAAGHVFRLQPLDDAQIEAALRREADARGFSVGAEVTRYLVTRFPRDLTGQMALLDRIDEFALAEGRAVTVPLLKKMMEGPR